MGTIIDAFAFAREEKTAQGSLSMAHFERLLEELPAQPNDDAGVANWSVQGRLDSAGQSFLRLRVQASPTLVCQRCLMPFTHVIDSEGVMQLVKTAIDLDSDVVSEEPDDDEDAYEAELPEKVVGSHRFDLLVQIEDELLLSIPYVPKHDVCPGARPDPEAETETLLKRPSPFAVLEKLKQQV